MIHAVQTFGLILVELLVLFSLISLRRSQNSWWARCFRYSRRSPLR